jgi:nucleotide-binding universal stress UspA family protein
VAEALAELAEKERADCVVVGAHGRGALERRFLGSVSYGLLGLSNANVLVAREREATRERRASPAQRRPVVIRRVLAATDLSESGNRAVDYGLALLPEGGQLTLLHVLVRPLAADMVPIPDTWGAGPEERRMDRALAMAELNELVPEQTRTIEVLTEVAEAIDVQHGVLQAAERHDADVVVLGRRGRGGVVAALMGSSARAVAGRSPRPVLLVPETPETA